MASMQHNKIEEELNVLENMIKKDIEEKNNIKNIVKHLLNLILYINTNTNDYSNETTNHLNKIYNLIFEYSHKDIYISTEVMCGFMLFGKSKNGKKSKPMIDYFMLEAIDILVETNGWSVIKPIVVMMKEEITNFEREQAFGYICKKIIKQLNTDKSMIQTSVSDLSRFLPRERSYEWGWFSYYIVSEMYQNNNKYSKPIKKRFLRKYLMEYRKLLTTLRSSNIIQENTTFTSNENIRYIIDRIMKQPVSVDSDEDIIIIENPQPDTQTQTQEPQPQPQEQQPDTQPQQSAGWFSGWFSGWM